MTPEREREYEELLSYIGLFATVVYQLDPTSSAHPSNAIEEIIRQFGKSKALVRLRQAANDTVEKASSWNLEARAIADDGFRAAGVVILSEITRRYATSYKRIVKRGVIKNETEYHVINAILVDQASAISDADRTVLKGLQKHSNARANCSGCEMFDHPSAGNVCFGSFSAVRGRVQFSTRQPAMLPRPAGGHWRVEPPRVTPTH